MPSASQLMAMPQKSAAVGKDAARESVLGGLVSRVGAPSNLLSDVGLARVSRISWRRELIIYNDNLAANRFNYILY